MSLFAKLISLFPGRRRLLEQDMREELESVAALASSDGARPGLVNLTRAAEEARTVWTFVWLEQLCSDVRYAARTMRRQPGFAVAAVLSLALGIGATTAIFSLAQAILLKELPVHDPASLVMLTSYTREGRLGDFGYGDFLALRDVRGPLAGILAASRLGPVTAVLNGEPETLQRKIVSTNYFELLGVHPAVGRMFSSDEEDQPVAVISYRLWQRLFSASPAIGGARIDLDGVAFTVAGVAVPGFLSETIGEEVDVWTTAHLMPPARRNAGGFTWLNLMGRLRPGADIRQVEGILKTSELQNRFIERIAAEPGHRGGAGLRNTFRGPLLALLGAAAMALLITCANLAGLLLARAAARRKEIATRLAIGASRGRVFRQLITESVFLAVLGGLAALLFAQWVQRGLLALVAGAGRTVSLDLQPNATVLLFALSISLGTGLLFGLAPALQAVRLTPGSEGKRWGLRNVLLAFQVALSLMLLVIGGLFIQTVSNLRSQDLGLRASNVVTVELDVRRGYAPAWRAVIPELMQRLTAIPGVTAATVALNGALANASGVNGLQIEGRPPAVEPLRAGANWVSPRYFETLGIPLIQGREFQDSDHVRSQRVAIVNQSMARRYLDPGQQIGARILFNGAAYEIVGIAKDGKYSDLRETNRPFIYFAALQGNPAIRTVELRTSGPALNIASEVRKAVQTADPGLKVVRISTLEERIEQKLAREVLLADLAGSLGAFTLILVAAGVYGSLAYAIARRSKEIGIRIALGARAGAVARTVLRDVLLVTVVGVAGGVAAALAAGRLMQSLVFGLKPSDPVTIAAAALTLALAAVAAGILPVIRACRMDPVSTLRLE